jgi:hypothetical protein
LTRDDQFTFLQITFDNFRLRAISQAHRYSARLKLAVLTHHPDNSRLTFQHRSTRRRKVALATLLIAALLSCLR